MNLVQMSRSLKGALAHSTSEFFGLHRGTIAPRRGGAQGVRTRKPALSLAKYCDFCRPHTPVAGKPFAGATGPMEFEVRNDIINKVQRGEWTPDQKTKSTR